MAAVPQMTTVSSDDAQRLRQEKTRHSSKEYNSSPAWTGHPYTEGSPKVYLGDLDFCEVLSL